MHANQEEKAQLQQINYKWKYIQSIMENAEVLTPQV
jgi:hypothetical protein